MTLDRASFDELRDDWRVLAEASGNVFATPEFAETWWRHFGRGRELLLAAAPGVVLPLYRWRSRPLRILRFLGHDAGDELGPVHAPGEPAAVGAMRELLAQERWDMLLADHLPARASWAGALAAQTLLRDGSPVLDLGGRLWEEVVATFSSNLREQVRRRERKLAREHEVAFRLTGAESLDDDLDTAFRLHTLRWGHGQTTYARREQFHREFARVALERGWLRLWILEVAGRPAAAWHGFRFAGAESYYQLGRDPALDRESVGFVLLVHTMRAAAADGMREYRFLRGDEPYKYRFASDDPGVETLAVARGVRGGAALRLAGAARRARRAYRLARIAVRRRT